jgi:hypothetical protein
MSEVVRAHPPIATNGLSNSDHKPGRSLAYTIITSRDSHRRHVKLDNAAEPATTSPAANGSSS